MPATNTAPADRSNISRAAHAVLFPGREVVVRTLPPGALGCSFCDWRSTYTAEFPTVGSRTYFCPPCSRERGRVVALRRGLVTFAPLACFEDVGAAFRNVFA